MTKTIESTPHLSGEPHEWLCTLALRALEDAPVPMLVGGAFAFTHYTGIVRETKDLDFFVRAADLDIALGALRQAGFATCIPFPHWLAKARLHTLSIDVIFASGNGLGRVTDDWFRYAPDATLYGERVRIVPPEELLCSKAFVMERERYDGADVAHLLRTQGKTLDWDRIIQRFSLHLPVLMSHLFLFCYIYSDGYERLPAGLFDEVERRSRALLHQPTDQPVCRGPLLSRAQFLSDITMRGYADARLTTGAMTRPDIQVWTDAIDSGS